MTVIIKTGPRAGRDRQATVKQLVALANGNLRHIVSTTSGVEVPDELAYEFLRDTFEVSMVVADYRVTDVPDPGPVTVVPVRLADVVKASAPSAEATPPVVAVESIPVTELAEPKPKKPRKPRKTAVTVSDEGA